MEDGTVVLGNGTIILGIVSLDSDDVIHECIDPSNENAWFLLQPGCRGNDTYHRARWTIFNGTHARTVTQVLDASARDRGTLREFYGNLAFKTSEFEPSDADDGVKAIKEYIAKCGL